MSNDCYRHSRFESCRDRVAAEANRCAREYPEWAVKLLVRFKTSDLVTAVERLVDYELKSASAQVRKRPYVHLTRFAEHLNAEIRFRCASEAWPASIPGGDAIRGSGWQRGVLYLIGDNRWAILGGGGDLPSKRASVAHELAHALLYRKDDAGIDVALWRRSRCTPLEEWVCNYMTRLILMPYARARRWIRRDRNAAEQVVAIHQGQFRAPAVLATLRWLECARGIGRNHAFAIMWKQYTPLDATYIKSCLRASPSLGARIIDCVRRLCLASPLTPQEGMLFWRAAIGGTFWRAQGLERKRDEQSRIVETILSVRHVVDRHARGGDRSGLLELQRTLSERSVRPVWYALRQRPHGRFYVPLNRGGARAGSVISTLLQSSGAVARQRLETVRIGSVSGTFRVDAFAHGSAAEGSRRILALYEDVSEELTLWDAPDQDCRSEID